MRWSFFILLQCLLIGIAAGVIYMHKDRVAIVKKPPASLAQWYKPENKRQVWLHNMFKLRRETQAIRYYADHNDAKHLKKWVARFRKHYLEVGRMVPEWQKKLNLAAVARLQKSTGEKDFQDIPGALDEIDKSCKSCHTGYRAVAASMYRAPDFSRIKISPSTTFQAHMKKLVEQVNRIKIASGDGRKDSAIASLTDLKEGISRLGKTCINCHKKEAIEYPSDGIRKAMSSLGHSLKSGTLKDQGEDLGALAVLACARCHGTHRIAFDIRKTFTDKPDWLQLIRH